MSNMTCGGVSVILRNTLKCYSRRIMHTLWCPNTARRTRSSRLFANHTPYRWHTARTMMSFQAANTWTSWIASTWIKWITMLAAPWINSLSSLCAKAIFIDCPLWDAGRCHTIAGCQSVQIYVQKHCLALAYESSYPFNAKSGVFKRLPL